MLLVLKKQRVEVLLRLLFLNKQTGNFVTTCQLTEREVTELKATHNFGGKEGWFSGKVNNLPPKGITPINRFENDVMGITPVNDSQIDNSNN